METFLKRPLDIIIVGKLTTEIVFSKKIKWPELLWKLITLISLMIIGELDMYKAIK